MEQLRPAAESKKKLSDKNSDLKLIYKKSQECTEITTIPKNEHNFFTHSKSADFIAI